MISAQWPQIVLVDEQIKCVCVCVCGCFEGEWDLFIFFGLEGIFTMNQFETKAYQGNRL